MYWIITAIYLFSTTMIILISQRQRKRDRELTESIWRRHIDEYEAKVKADMKTQLETAFCKGASAGAQSLVHVLKHTGLLDPNLNINFHAVIKEAVEHQPETDEQFLRSLKIKP